jgi:hypothetical protein
MGQPKCAAWIYLWRFVAVSRLPFADLTMITAGQELSRDSMTLMRRRRLLRRLRKCLHEAACYENCAMMLNVEYYYL